MTKLLSAFFYGAALIAFITVHVQKIERRAAARLAFQERSASLDTLRNMERGIYFIGNDAATLSGFYSNRITNNLNRWNTFDGNAASFISCNSDGFPVNELKSCRCDEHGHTTC
jgi:hypothetical protein